MEEEQQQNREVVLRQLGAVAETLRQTAVALTNKEAAQNDVASSLSQVVSQLQELERANDQMDDVLIPMELLKMVDRGESPEAFRALQLEEAAIQARGISSVAKAFDDLKGKIEEDLGTTLS